MMPDTRELLETELGSVYSLERELTGGGMSRVFLAEERRLGRKVVLKVRNLDSGILGPRYLEDSLRLEPDADHFDLLALPRVERYLADALSRLEVVRT